MVARKASVKLGTQVSVAVVDKSAASAKTEQMEQLLQFGRAHSNIVNIAVIGLPDARLGEIAAAIIEVKPGETLSEEDVENFCKSLPRYQRPRKLIFATVPRNPTGKIEKPLLRKTYGGANLVAQQNELK